jgi:hypothetical protein
MEGIYKAGWHVSQNILDEGNKFVILLVLQQLLQLPRSSHLFTYISTTNKFSFHIQLK